MQLIDLDIVKPELVLCSTIVVLIACNLFNLNRALFFVSIAGIITHVATGSYDQLFKVIIACSALVTILISGKQQRTEFYLLIISILLGADLLMASKNFIMVLLSMELISISSYVLTAGFQADKKRSEAAWKFFIYGSVATAVMIFGMSYLYGATGTISINAWTTGNLLVPVGGLMLVGGLLFKMTAVPFHLWAPDVYEATPSPIIAFFSVVPKLAGFIVLQQVFAITPSMFAVIATVTIVVGTLAALNQKNSKRMMAYSSVAQAGFFLAVINGPPGIWQFYAVVFAATSYTVFIVIHEQEKSGGKTNFRDFSAIGYSNTFASVAITLGLISLVGLPPLAGFMGKLLIFSHVWEMYTGTGSSILLTLFSVGLLATVASLFFYLKIPFYAFFRRSEEKEPLKISLATNLLLIILVGTLLALFLAPGLLMG